jgi:hypothetical protein
MRAKYAEPRNGAPPTTVVARSRAVTKRVVPPPITPAVFECGFQIERPHPLVRASRAGLRDVRVDYDNLLDIAGPDRLDLKVSRAALPRALWIMDRFIKRFQAEGYQVGSRGRSTTVVGEGKHIPVRIRESVNRSEKPKVEREYSCHRYNYAPNGVLTFHVLNERGSARKYSDSVRSRLEDKLESVLKGIREEFARLKCAEEEQRAREMIQRFELKAEAARERERLGMRQRIESLLADADAWQKSQRIRAYLAAFSAAFEKWSGPIDPASEVGKWLQWAKRHADSLDPLCPDI